MTVTATLESGTVKALPQPVPPAPPATVAETGLHPDTLALATRARLVPVGKRCGRHSTAQRFINKRLVDAARDGQLERLQQALGDRPRAGTVGSRLGAECLEDSDHAAAGLPSSSRGCGTAAITASRTSSALRSSASAW